MAVGLDTNLADLPLLTVNQLSSVLNQNNVWLKVLDSDKRNAFFSSDDEIKNVMRQANPAQAILQRWGNRGQTVKSFIVRLQGLQYLSDVDSTGVAFDPPQLVLRRTFKSLRWASEATPIQITPNDERQEISLKALAVGFPSPQFQWLLDNEPVGLPGHTLLVNKCQCKANSRYVCKVWNEVEDGQSFSDHYRTNGKAFSSELLSEPVDLRTYVHGAHACSRCEEAEVKKIREMLEMSRHDEGTTERIAMAAACENLVAADKVALIISNCVYEFLPKLVTPHCDAETLAKKLQELQFKTVTLADLTLAEMREMFAQYKRLLGNDVYAVLYFAGHGFEVSGQCYLLPVDAPTEAHAPEYCISMDWVLASLTDCVPALHLILLDVCRKYIPLDCVPKFIEEAERYKRMHRANRNTVYGYSTSGGVGAYEVKGETNGVFMTYLKGHVDAHAPVMDMLQKVFVDIGNDARVKEKQIPELRSTLTKARSLRDELVCDGHTASFDQHNVHWRQMHELPLPVYVRFEEQQLMVTIWFDYCGRFTNKVYVFSSVDQLPVEDEEGTEEGRERAAMYLAYLKFAPVLETSTLTVLEDDEEGVSVRVLLSHLQRSQGPIECTVQLTETQSKRVTATRETSLGHVLITRIQSNLRKN
ncbi:hypothetical protein PENTCL1PPCAC_8878 [Pristionchus entomophagus]|uniref:Caspase family p20 domain-containing protein n=1 Tax=Pristionchus entomophagus TaxID=358040 RepID=A0AAV5SUB0_9BILA|nr:hypothetical protein PENTCL1PPCAC_8878 [Pristionchus entomophagus]